jgi:NTE family protein
MRIGLALGGGGAKGLAHIPILETLDAMGIRPAAIAGTSIGAILGALYASGMSGARMRQEIDEVLFSESEKGEGALFDLSKGFRLLLDLVDIEVGSGGFIHGEKFVKRLYEDVRARSFEELQIPLKVVATEFWSRRQVVFESGELLRAVRASMSLPVLFAPVVIGDEVLMDGGTVNPVPYDLLLDECDVTIAVDVAGRRSASPDSPIPSLSETIFNTIQIMSKAILDEKLRRRPPDLLLRPDVVDIQVLEFDKAPEIYAQAGPACGELREGLEKLLASV